LTQKTKKENGIHAMISIIVPIYQVEQYLCQSIESILNQTYKQFELLLIDDESTDTSGKICDEYATSDSRIRVFHIKHSGLSVARNKGIEEARGEWIGFVDSDDWIEPEMYNSLLSAVEQSGADIAVCGFVSSTGKESILTGGTYSSDQAMRKLLDSSINNTVWNKLYRRELFNTIRFPEDRNFEDIAIQHLLLHRASSITVIEDIAYHYRVREGSIAHTYSVQNLLDFAVAYMDRFQFYSALYENLHGKSSAGGMDNREREQLLKIVASGISRVWRWWYGCDEAKKAKDRSRIHELKQFTADHFPLFGYPSWEKELRISTFFMHYDSKWSFAVLFFLNHLYKKINKLLRTNNCPK